MTAIERPKLGAILLAAGGSSRLGRPKQLLKFEGETLVRRSARTLAESVYYPVIVVLGAQFEAVEREVEGLPVYSVTNGDWPEGMASSITTGLNRLLEIEPDVDGALIALCDQPKVTGEILGRFADRFCESNADVVASAYDRVSGVPAIFSKELFGELSRLEGDKGARQIIRNCRFLQLIDLPEAAVDIDTESDVDRLLARL